MLSSLIANRPNRKNTRQKEIIAKSKITSAFDVIRAFSSIKENQLRSIHQYQTTSRFIALHFKLRFRTYTQSFFYNSDSNDKLDRNQQCLELCLELGAVLIWWVSRSTP